MCCFYFSHQKWLLHNNPYCCCYGPFDPGEAKAAGTHLCQVFGQEPRDAVAQARVGVVEALHQNYRSAVHRLSKLTEKDSSCLDFLLTLVPSNQRQTMAQVKPQAGLFNAYPLIQRTTDVHISALFFYRQKYSQEL